MSGEGTAGTSTWHIQPTWNYLCAVRALGLRVFRKFILSFSLTTRRLGRRSSDMWVLVLSLRLQSHVHRSYCTCDCYLGIVHCTGERMSAYGCVKMKFTVSQLIRRIVGHFGIRASCTVCLRIEVNDHEWWLCDVGELMLSLLQEREMNYKKFTAHIQCIFKTFSSLSHSLAGHFCFCCRIFISSSWDFDSTQRLN